MSEVTLHPQAGLAGLLCALQPVCSAAQPPEPEPAPDPAVAIEDVRAEAFAAGFATGEAAAADALAPAQAAMKGAAAALLAACDIETKALREPLAALVRAIAERVLAAELIAGATVLMPLVDAALAQLAPDAAPVLRAHQDTLVALEGRLGTITGQPDPAMAVDSFVIEGPTFMVQASLAARLDEAMAALT